MINHPTITCLCGSVRFAEEFQRQNELLTLRGNIVLSIGVSKRGLREAVAEMLDSLHLCKIDLADEILVLNVDGYIGKSTANEIAYAKERGKRIYYLEKEE